MAAASAVLDSGRCSLVMEHTSKQDHCNHLNVSVDVAIDVPSRSTQAPSRPVPSSNVSSSRAITNWRFHMRPGPFDSQRYILIEMIISVILITACIIVLALSRNEKPHSLITVWILGYASGCLATLPNLYLRYRRRFLKFVELFEFATRCFFLFWVPFGFKLMDGHLSSSDAPNQYRLCSAIVLTTLISYVSFTIALLCHVPCIEFFSYLFGSPEDQTQTRGASLEIVGSLPKYKFKTKKPIEGNGSKYDYDPSKTSGEDGIITVGTGKEKSVSAEDEMCCICLRKYKDDEHLRELPCTHYFHVKCVDKWLKMNASCPLCKHEIGGPSEAASESVGDRRQSGNR